MRTQRMAASDWLQRMNRDDVPEEEFHAWLDWRAESPENDRAFEEMQQLYRALRDAPESDRAWLRKAVLSPSRRRISIRPMWALAATVVIAVAIAAVYGWQKMQVPQPQQFATARAEHRTVTLNDGSQLVLGGKSSVDVNYLRQQRLLSMNEGEALFRVQHDPGRPFVVRAGTVRVTAIGTAFDIQRSADRVAVSVTEGRVRLDTGTRNLHLIAGQRAEVVLSNEKAGRDSAPRLTRIDTSAAVAWQDGQLQFINEPLSVVIDSVNRYARGEVVIGEPSIARMTYTGTVQRNRADEWIENLPQVFPIRALPIKNGSVVLVAR